MEMKRRKQQNPSKYTDWTREKEAKEFVKYRRNMIERAEQLVLRHRTALQQKKHYNFFNKLQNEEKDDVKLRMLDELIEEDIMYFNAKAGDTNSMAM